MTIFSRHNIFLCTSSSYTLARLGLTGEAVVLYSGLLNGLPLSVVKLLWPPGGLLPLVILIGGRLGCDEFCLPAPPAEYKNSIYILLRSKLDGCHYVILRLFLF